MKLNLPFLLLPLLLFSCPTLALAEPERGRLADGRAFRTDVEGTQIIDYIAELELSVEALQRRVYGLENEIDEKDRTLSRLRDRASSGVDEGVRERDILARSSGSSQKQPSVVGNSDCAELESELRAEFARSQDLHRRQVRDLEQSLEHSKRQILSMEISLSEQADQFEALEANFEGRLAQVQNQLLATEEARKVAAEEVSIEAQRRQELRSERERLAAELRSARQEPGRASQRVVTQAAPSLAERQTGTAARAGTAAMQSDRTAAQRAAVDSLRGNLNREHGQLSRLHQQRAELFQQYGQRNKSGLVVRPQSAVSRRGWDINEVRRRIDSADTVQELAILQREIREIEQKLREDISLVSRLAG